MLIKSLATAMVLLTSLPLFSAQQAPATSLDLATARVDRMPNNHYLDGTVEAVNKSTVSAQTSGQVEEILFDIDDFVEKDQVIARLRDTPQRTALEQAEAHYNQVKSDRERIFRVYKQGVATEADMEQAETSLTSARAALENAREQLDYTVIKAPYNGIVTQRHLETGEAAAPGTPLMSGISLEKLRVNVDVPQSLINKIREFDKATILSGEGPLIHVSKITIYPYADPASGTFHVRLELPKTEQKLFPGMFVKVAFLTGEREYLTVPSASIVYRSEVTGVYVVAQSGHISLRHIRVGRTFGERTVILAGLEPGEQIAIDPIRAGAMARQTLTQE